MSETIDWFAALIDSNGKAVRVTMTPDQQSEAWAGHYDVRVENTDEHRTVRADTGFNPDGDYSIRNVAASTCILCAGKCRGHSLGDPAEWEPEVGSVAAMANASCDCAARFYGDDRNAHQGCCALATTPARNTSQIGEG